jgi:hypothetical protein
MLVAPVVQLIAERLKAVRRLPDGGGAGPAVWLDEDGVAGADPHPVGDTFVPLLRACPVRG